MTALPLQSVSKKHSNTAVSVCSTSTERGQAGRDGRLTWVLDIDTDAIVEQTIRTVDVEIGYPLLLHDAIRLDCKRFGIARHSHFAIGSRVEVVNLLPSLIANLGPGV